MSEGYDVPPSYRGDRLEWNVQKGQVNPSRDKKVRQAPQKEGGENFCVAFSLCDPGGCVHIFTDKCSLTSRIDGMTTNSNNKNCLKKNQNAPRPSEHPPNIRPGLVNVT